MRASNRNSDLDSGHRETDMADENGLLGDISGVLHSILGNEFVQGAGLVGATGLNPLIGLLAGPIIKDDRERRELENDLVRESLKDSRSRREGATRLAGILGQEAIPAGAPLDVLNLEGGILAQTPGIPGVVPSASQSRVPFISTPQGRQEALGASAQAAPAALVNQLAGGILGQESPRRQSVDARLQVGRELGLTGDDLIEFVGGGGGDSFLETLLGGLRAEDIQGKIIERNQQIQTETDLRAEAGNRLNSSAESILSLETRIDSLEGTGVFANPLDLETAFGVASIAPESLVRGVTGFVGEPMSKEDIADLRNRQQEFNIFANDVLVNTAGDLDAIGRTDAGRSLLAGTKPSSDLGAQPNIAAAALAAKRVLDADTDRQLQPEVRRRLEALIQRAEGGNAERQQDINDARRALAEGKPRHEIEKILIDNGIDPAVLDQ